MGAVWGIVVAGGRGSRFGAPKQFADLAGIRVVDRSVLAAIDACDAVVLVVPAGCEWDGPAVDAVVAGGDTRSASVRAGLAAVPPDADVVVVHDAARPLAPPSLFRRVIATVIAGADGAVPGVPVPDTLKRVAGVEVVETVDRDVLVIAQTPQAFRADVLRAAHEEAGEASDDAALVEAHGGKLVVVPGDPANRKITTPIDLVVAAASLA
jgi:2-C-methyl-D-erythritol 4-phosphate cytidylyltransferase